MDDGMVPLRLLLPNELVPHDGGQYLVHQRGCEVVKHASTYSEVTRLPWHVTLSQSSTHGSPLSQW